MLHSPSKSLQFGRIKNEGLEVVQTPPNPSLSFLKKHPNKIIKLLSLSLLYSPFFPQPPNIAYRFGRSENLGGVRSENLSEGKFFRIKKKTEKNTSIY